MKYLVTITGERRRYKETYMVEATSTTEAEEKFENDGGELISVDDGFWEDYTITAISENV